MSTEKLTQKFKGLFSGGEDRGVSPVIGVILMVAITVVLAAVIAAAVMGIGGDIGSGSAPTATFSSSDDAAAIVTFVHDGGDTIQSDNLYIVEGENRVKVDGDNSDFTAPSDSVGTGQQITATFGGSGSLSDVTVSKGDEIRLVYDDGSTSSTLASHTASAALNNAA